MSHRSPTRRTRLAALATATLLVLAGCNEPAGDPNGLGTQSPTPQPTTRTGSPSSPTASESSAQEPSPEGPARPRVVGTIATDLVAPWGIDFLPDGTALVGERDTTKVLAVSEGSVRTVGRLEAVEPGVEAGLLGIAVSPDFAADSLVYVYFSSAVDNRVVKMTYDGRRLGPPVVILKGIPRGAIHDGGRLEFGPDGHLYVSTGETGDEQLSQDRSSLAGKILRITTDGEPAPGNPVDGSAVFTMGHRNVQGLAFDDRDRLWASEFGANTWDELNQISKGRNYGWPLVEGRGDLEEYRNPHAQWRTSEASPSGLAFLDGSLWMASLRGQRLWRIPVNADGSVGQPQDFFVGDYGRMRTVVVAPNGNLWVSTSNRDGRGDPAPQDDRILEIALR